MKTQQLPINICAIKSLYRSAHLANDQKLIESIVVKSTHKIVKIIDESDFDLSLGTGSIVDQKNGIIVTNAHVCADTREVLVQYFNHLDADEPIERLAVVVYVEPFNDLALLMVRFAEDDLCIDEIGVATDGPTFGDTVISLGFIDPYDGQPSPSTGLISCPIVVNLYEPWIPCDRQNHVPHTCAMFSGFSGGPLINENLLLVGANHGKNLDYSYAVQIDKVFGRCRQMLNYKYIYSTCIHVIKYIYKSFQLYVCK